MSKKNILYVQCKLEKDFVDWITVIYVWISEKYAVKDKILKLKNNYAGEWEDGWKVTDIYKDIKKTEEQAIIDAEAYKYQREVSDI